MLMAKEADVMKKFFVKAVLGLCTLAFLSGSGMAAPVQADSKLVMPNFVQADSESAMPDSVQAGGEAAGSDSAQTGGEAAESAYLQAANKVEVSYQILSVSDNDVQRKINVKILQRADELQKDINEIVQNGDALSASLDSVIAYQDKSIVSIKTDEYIYVEHAAHPMSWTYGNVFSLADGRELSLEDIAAMPAYKAHAARYTWSSVKRALIAQYGDVLFSCAFNLAEVPKDVYIDADAHVHVVIQRYELAPYAAGILDVDLDAE